MLVRLSKLNYYIVSSSPCQAYPSEYAYRDGSVNRAESVNANCRRYQSGLSALPLVFTERYTHCDGTQLKLTDSDLEQEQYRVTDYYVWIAGRDEQLLLIFPTGVSLTSIILHYYSDSHRGLPRLRFYAVPDDFDARDVPTTSYPHTDVKSVPSSGEPEGRRRVSINVNFNTCTRNRKVLIYKYSSSSMFSVSEVEFFICENTSKHLYANYHNIILHYRSLPDKCP